MKKLTLLLATLLLSCAHAKEAGAPPDTDVTVTDEGGEPLLGTVKFWSRAKEAECTIEGSRCYLELPAGEYFVTFRKIRAGRVGGSIGGSTGGQRGSGCLRMKVLVKPGEPIVCKKRAEFNCAKGANQTMDCGAANAPPLGYKPQGGQSTPDDEPNE